VAPDWVGLAEALADGLAEAEGLALADALGLAEGLGFASFIFFNCPGGTPPWPGGRFVPCPGA